MSNKKILSVAASIIKLFIILILLISNSKAEENNIKYYSDDVGTLALMYHRFNENKYPSTNIEMDVFEKQINIIKNNKYNFYFLYFIILIFKFSNKLNIFSISTLFVGFIGVCETNFFFFPFS